MTDETMSPWCKLPFGFTAQYSQVGVKRFKESKNLKFDLGSLDRDHREMRRTLVYPNKHGYVEKYVLHEVQMVKPLTLTIIEKVKVRVYLQIRPKFEKGSYLENEIAIPEDLTSMKKTTPKKKETKEIKQKVPRAQDT